MYIFSYSIHSNIHIAACILVHYALHSKMSVCVWWKCVSFSLTHIFYVRSFNAHIACLLSLSLSMWEFLALFFASLNREYHTRIYLPHKLIQMHAHTHIHWNNRSRTYKYTRDSCTTTFPLHTMSYSHSRA